MNILLWILLYFVIGFVFAKLSIGTLYPEFENCGQVFLFALCWILGIPVLVLYHVTDYLHDHPEHPAAKFLNQSVDKPFKIVNSTIVKFFNTPFKIPLLKSIRKTC